MISAVPTSSAVAQASAASRRQLRAAAAHEPRQHTRRERPQGRRQQATVRAQRRQRMVDRAAERCLPVRARRDVGADAEEEPPPADRLDDRKPPVAERSERRARRQAPAETGGETGAHAASPSSPSTGASAGADQLHGRAGSSSGTGASAAASTSALPGLPDGSQPADRGEGEEQPADRGRDQDERGRDRAHEHRGRDAVHAEHGGGERARERAGAAGGEQGPCARRERQRRRDRP